MIILITNIMVNILYSVYNDMKQSKTSNPYLNLESNRNVCLISLFTPFQHGTAVLRAKCCSDAGQELASVPVITINY